MLGALSAWLAKAEAQMPDGEADRLLSQRLAPDMFPLSTQVRFACVQAQEGVFRLQGRAFPETIELLLNEGRNAAERPGSIADAPARIDETLGAVNALAAEALDVDPETPIAHSLPAGMMFDLTAEQYARDWALPQSISRHDRLCNPAEQWGGPGQGGLRRSHVPVPAARHDAHAVVGCDGRTADMNS